MRRTRYSLVGLAVIVLTTWLSNFSFSNGSSTELQLANASLFNSKVDSISSHLKAGETSDQKIKAAKQQSSKQDAARGLLANNSGRLAKTVLENNSPVESVTRADDKSSRDFQSIAKTSRTLKSELRMPDGRIAALTIDQDLQSQAEDLFNRYSLPYGALVAVKPDTGEILTLAGGSSKSQSDEGYQFALRAGMPAASLIKVVSAAAAIERGGVRPNLKIRFRGGNYTLNKWNYKPDARRDTRVISLEKALATSNNPAFGRLGVQVTGADLLTTYADSFGFNRDIPFVLPLEKSEFAEIIDDYSLARTAAGFGEVTISPLHAAMLIAAVANDGVMMRPRLISSFGAKNQVSGKTLPEQLFRVVSADTAVDLMEMMELTVKSGTGRRQFSARRAPKLKGIRIAAKTGTLSGENPEGRYHWLIAAAPIDNPEIAIAALVVDTGNAKINGAALGRLFLERYFAKYPPGSGSSV